MIGIDIVSISRISKIYTKFGDKFLDKILSGKEQNSVLNLNYNLKLERLAGIYAAKEAFAKALGVGISADFGFLDVEILKNDRGAPFLEIAPCIIKKFNIKSGYNSRRRICYISRNFRNVKILKFRDFLYI